MATELHTYIHTYPSNTILNASHDLCFTAAQLTTSVVNSATCIHGLCAITRYETSGVLLTSSGLPHNDQAFYHVT